MTSEPITRIFNLYTDSVLDFNPAEYGPFKNFQLISVSGEFNPILVEEGDKISFSNGFTYTVSQEFFSYDQLASAINTTADEDILSISTVLIESIYEITYADPRIRYMLGLNDQNIPTYKPSNVGSPFIVINANFPTGIYTKDGSGTIGSVSNNVFMYGSPFSLEGFAHTDQNSFPACIRLEIQDIHNENIRYHSLLRWCFALF